MRPDREHGGADTDSQPRRPGPNDAGSDVGPLDLSSEEVRNLRAARAKQSAKKRLFRRLSIGIVVTLIFIVGLLFVGPGWPLLATVDSGSMAPNIKIGDTLVIWDDESPFGVGVAASIQTASGPRDGGKPSFGRHGSVIAYDPPGDGPVILHRVHMAVEKGGNWVARANKSGVDGTCVAVPTCPAPHDGYITKGDANEEYDQVAGIAPPVKRSWIRGVAVFKIQSPKLPFVLINKRLLHQQQNSYSILSTAS